MPNWHALRVSTHRSGCSDRFAALAAKLGITPYVVAEESMTPALKPGDGLLTVRLRHPRRGRVVVLEHPERAGLILVKRIIGLPGETVTIEAGRLLVDGEAIPEPWAQGHAGADGRWHVDDTSIFVVSDARELTRADSRRFGPLPIRGSRRVIRVVRGALPPEATG